MKIYKIELMIVDFDGVGKEGIKHILENTNYPNYCINPTAISIESRDIGDWRDDHPLNLKSKLESEFRKLFA